MARCFVLVKMSVVPIFSREISKRKCLTRGVDATRLFSAFCPASSILRSRLQCIVTVRKQKDTHVSAFPPPGKQRVRGRLNYNRRVFCCTFSFFLYYIASSFSAPDFGRLTKRRLCCAFVIHLNSFLKGTLVILRHLLLLLL